MSVAEPKYFFPAAFAAVLRPPVAELEPEVVVLVLLLVLPLVELLLEVVVPVP